MIGIVGRSMDEAWQADFVPVPLNADHIGKYGIVSDTTSVLDLSAAISTYDEYSGGAVNDSTV